MAIKVGYQGKNGTFSEIAVLKYFENQKIKGSLCSPKF